MFERFDASAIADHFAYPCHITSDAGEITLMPVTSRQAWVGQLEQLLKLYRTSACSSAQVLDLTFAQLSPRLVQAATH